MHAAGLGANLQALSLCALPVQKRHELEQAHDALHHGHEHHHHHHGVVKDDGVPELDPESSVSKAKVEIHSYRPHAPAPYGEPLSPLLHRCL